MSRLEPPSIMAARVFPDERVTPMLLAPREAERVALCGAVRGDRSIIGQAILSALRSPDSLELLRALAEDLGAKDPPLS